MDFKELDSKSSTKTLKASGDHSDKYSWVGIKVFQNGENKLRLGKCVAFYAVLVLSLLLVGSLVVHSNEKDWLMM